MPEPIAADAPETRLTILDPGHRPSAKAPYAWALTSTLWWIPLSIVVWFVFFHGPARDWRWVAVAALAALGVAGLLIMPAWRYQIHRWEIGATAIYTRSGWLTQERRIAPIARIQTVDTERGPVEQLLGLSTVTITTASSAGKVRISALDKPVADAMAAQLAVIVGELSDDAT
ncbi:PH domain-containing protein [Tomitella biformata]|uniref:PH domain-containing protein n=1 Tax=Tomitella biformata TaxID=630403 RepID=UPI0004657F23|nr:PH domain-containing protein [Tomitella biformata]